MTRLFYRFLNNDLRLNNINQTAATDLIKLCPFFAETKSSSHQKHHEKEFGQITKLAGKRDKNLKRVDRTTS
jgi:hypothetical protein